MNASRITVFCLAFFVATLIPYANAGGKADSLRITDNNDLELQLQMPSDTIIEGGEFYLRTVINNPGDDLTDVPVFIVLSLRDEYWFWPSWIKYPPTYDYVVMDIPQGVTEFYAIEPMTWPDLDTSIMDIYFYGAMLNHDMTAIIGKMSSLRWDFFCFW